MQGILNWFKVVLPRIFHRTRDLIANPKGTWEEIKDEDVTVRSLFKDYLLIIPAIPALAIWLGWGTQGFRIYIGKAILLYGLSILVVWGFSRIIIQFGPKFQAVVSEVNALKLVLFSFWPVFIAGILYLIPLLSIFSIVGYVYGFYLFYLGVPVLVDIPEEKLASFRVTGIIVMALALYLLSFITNIAGYPSFYW